MKYAIVTIGTRVKIDKTTSTAYNLSYVYKHYHDFSVATPITKSTSLYDGKKRLLDNFTQDLKRFLEEYVESMDINRLKYKGATIVDFYFDKNFPNDDYIVIEFYTAEYTVLDSTGDKILLKEGDLREELKKNEPTITNAFFLQINPEIGFTTYIPY